MSFDERIEVFFLGADELFHIVLPACCEGSYPLYVKQEKIEIQIVARSGKWHVLIFDGWKWNMNERFLLQVNNLYELHKGNVKAVVWAKFYRAGTHCFRSYACKKSQITIGRAADCEIVYGQDVISQYHARLYHQNGTWYIEDLKSTNKTYVNAKRVDRQELEILDCIQIMELRIVVTPNGLCMNVPFGLALAKDAWKAIVKYDWKWQEQPLLEMIWLTPSIPPKQIVSIDHPPRSRQTPQTPAFLVLAPSMTMGISSLSMGLLSLLQIRMQQGTLYQVLPTVLMSVTMAFSSMIWPLVLHFYEQRKQKQQLQRVEKEYRGYLQMMKQRMQKEMQTYRQQRAQYFDACSLCEMLMKGKRMLIDHQKEDLLLGFYQEIYDIQFEEEKIGFVMDKEELEKEREKLLQAVYTMEDMPFVWRRKQYPYIVVEGKQRKVYLLGLLMQYVITHQEQEFGLIVHMDYEEAKRLQITGLAHLYNQTEGIRYLLSEQHKLPQLASALEKDDRQFLYVKLKEEFHVLDRYLLTSEKVSCLSLFPSKYAKTRLVVHDDVGIFYHGRQCEKFRYRCVTSKQWQTCMPQFIANQHWSFAWKKQTACSFLDMFQCGNTNALQIWQRWQKSDASLSLACTIGYNSHHQPLVLDAHEKGHGPHGLFAGMTGSGKTECLLTYILSMCVEYSPQAVNFLLIDYKGGVMAQTLSNLPHVVGIITNLDAALLQRSLYALKHELIYRQQLFMNASKQFHIGNMNIDSYNRFVKEHSDMEILSHLFIVADEFAEMKQQQPQFMEQLKQMARIGRSLGIHLLLATQKPYGVIDEQIWSNARFHLCMKVQSAQDSQDMLKNSDALHLKETGSCILQVGHNEIYEHGQIAWAQAAYEKHEEYISPRFREICLLGSDASIVETCSLQKQETVKKTQMEAVMAQIAKTAKEHHCFGKALWKQPLSIDFCTDHKIGAIVRIDDVLFQQQEDGCIEEKDFCHTLLCGDVTASKTMYLNSFLYALINCYADAAMVVYLFDFADHKLLAWKDKRLVCEVFTEADDERIAMFFHQLNKRLAQRSEQDFSYIILVIHNFELFCERYPQYSDDFVRYLRDGQQLKIICYISVRSVENVSYRYLPFFARTIAFFMQEERSLSHLFEQEDMLYPSKQQGNGIMLYKEHLVLFQTLALEAEDIANCLPQAPWQQSFCLRMLPDKVAHCVLSEGLYLGKLIEDVEDFYLDTRGTKYTLICAAKQLPNAFKQLFIKQLMKQDAIMVEKESELFDEKSKLCIWDKDMFSKESLYQYILQKSMQDSHSHYIFFEMSESHLAVQPFWQLEDKRILWIGEMLDRYSYEMCLEVGAIRLKHNQGMYMEGSKWEIFQIWEVENDV